MMVNNYFKDINVSEHIKETIILSGLENLYESMFDVFPDSFCCEWPASKNGYVDITKIDDSLIKIIFGEDVESIKKYTRTFYEPTSSADDEKLRISNISWISTNVSDRSEKSVVVVIDHSRRMIICISPDTIKVLYKDIDVECVESFVDNDIIKKLPIKFECDKKKSSVVGIVTRTRGYYDIIKSKINDTTIDISKNYNDDFKEHYERIVNFIKDDGRKTGLVLLNGMPGTGKTYLIKHLITNYPNNYVMLPSNMIAGIGEPDFISFLLDNRDSIFILEDCDNALKDRSSSFSDSMSSLLNAADGIMSDILNIKFICTFNTDISNVDSAVRRKGRCVDEYTFGKLSIEKTKNLLNELGIELDEYEELPISDIYNYDNRETENSNKKKKIGF